MRSEYASPGDKPNLPVVVTGKTPDVITETICAVEQSVA
jgi:hypothetical protein